MKLLGSGKSLDGKDINGGGEGTAAVNGKLDGDVGYGDKRKEERWCRKCDAAKPPRAHHCKSCMR